MNLREHIKKYNKNVTDEFIEELELCMVVGRLRDYEIDVHEDEMYRDVYEDDEYRDTLFVMFRKHNDKVTWRFTIRFCVDGYYDLAQIYKGSVAVGEELIIEKLRELV